MTNEVALIEVRCTDGCGTVEMMRPDAGCPPGWTILQITGRLRCPDCHEALQKVNRATVAFQERELKAMALYIRQYPEGPAWQEMDSFARQMWMARAETA